ncbi:MAG TPA: TonB-dependent receptor [Anaeromyxobacteraceae bacterium]|nr:TonB-dependent receptor [Anaeromyxobacteraceae bacterium]
MRKKSLSLFWLVPVALLAFAATASAQENITVEKPGAAPPPAAPVSPNNGTITGVVTDASTGNIVAGAVVIASSPALKGAEQTVVTDGSGRFTLPNLPPGDYKLQVQLGGYKPFERADLVVKADTTLRASLTVVPEAVQMEEVVVTGSRVRRLDLTAPAPVALLSHESIVESGRASVGDFLQLLPQQVTTFNQQVNNGGDGSIRVDLRGLGTQRTLVLLNGHRMVPSGLGTDTSVDLNTVPLNAVERVEVLPDGASAIYGSDAVAGVVNIITKRNYTGTSAQAQYGISSHGDGQSWDIFAQSGTSGDAGSVFFSAEYFNQQGIFSSARPWSSAALAYNANPDNGPVGTSPGGSGSVPAGYIAFAQAVPTDSTTWTPFMQQLQQFYPGQTRFINAPTNSANPGKACYTDVYGNEQCWRPYVSSGPNNDTYNYQSVNWLLTPLQRISLFTAGDAKLSSNARAYFEASYTNRSSSIQLASEPLNTGGTPIGSFIIGTDNVYNTTGIDVTWRKRMVEWGPRASSFVVDTAQIVVGADGKIPDILPSWTWDTSLNWGRNDASTTQTGSAVLSNLSSALGPNYYDPGSKTVICGTAANPIPAPTCVPLNMTGGVSGGPGSLAAATYVTGGALVNYGLDQQVVYEFNTQAEIWKIPTSDRMIGVAAGYQYLNEAAQYIANPISNAFNSFDYSGQSTPFGSYFVNAAYLELVLPLVSNMIAINDLEITGALRFSDYSNFGTNWSWKVGGRWRPIRDVTLRGTYSTAFRAPSIAELNGGTATSAEQATDPCQGPLTQGTTLYNNCKNNPGNKTNPNAALGPTGTGTGDTSTQFNSLVGGNPNLQPETAKVWTAGVVFEPTFLKGFSITADYWSYVVNNAISSQGAAVIIPNCYNTTKDAQPAACAAIQRDPVTGYIIEVNDTLSNVGTYSTAGIDMAAKYQTDTDIGKWGAFFAATWLNYFDYTHPDGGVQHVAGTYDFGSTGASSQGALYPHWKFNVNVNWAWKGWAANIANHFIGSFVECDGTAQGGPTGYYATGGGQCYQNPTGWQRSVGAYDTTDLYVSYTLKTTLGNTLFGFGVNNIFNAYPRYIYTAFSANTDPGYDWVGTFFYFRLGQTF